MCREMIASDIGYIGDMPMGWNIVPGKAMFDEVKSKNTDGAVTTALKFTYGEIVQKENFDASTEEYVADTIKSYNVVTPSDVVVNGLNLNYDFISQRVAIVKENGVITSAYVVLRPKPHINPRYLNYHLKACDNMKVFHGMGEGVRQTIKFDDLGNMLLLCPDRTTQDVIVRYLDSKCSAIDEAIERHKKIIEKLEEYWKSVVWTEINSHVDTTGKLKILFELHRGYDLTANSFVNGSVPVYGSGGFVGYHNEAKCVGPNVIIGRSGSTGKLTYVPDAVFWAHNTGIYVSDFRRNIPKYVYYLLLTIDIDSLANKTAVPTLDRKNVQNYVASFTTNTEQQNSIVDKLDVLYESIQKSKTIHEKSITKLEEYRKSIIYNAVTGKIDCRTEAVE